MKINDRRAWLFMGGGASFNPLSIKSKFAAWYKEEKASYIVDQLGSQEREILTQNSLAGQLFPGRAIEYDGSAKYNVYNGSQSNLDIGNDPIVISCWVKVPSFTAQSTSPLIGKHPGGSVLDGAFALATHTSSNFRAHFYDSEGVLKVKDTGALSINTWYHIVWGVDNTKNAFIFVDKVESGARTQLNGTFGACDTDIKWAFGAKFSPSTGATNGFKQSQIRGVRILRDTNVTQAIVNSLYNSEVTGLETNWWIMSENNNSIIYDCVGGLHMDSVGFNGAEKVTGYWNQPYNYLGYAENATFGQIPPDMTSLVDGVPQDDVLGNALVFKGQAKQNLIKSGGNLTMYGAASSTQLDTLIRAAKQVSLNTWFSSSTPQSIAEGSVTTYCASRQFYNATKKELIIIKFGESLTATEETNLMTYLSNPTIPTSYHADTTSYLARCVETYSNKLKSRIDNLFRLLDASGAKAELETVSVPCWGIGADIGLDLYNATYNVIDALNGHVNYVENKGLSPQDGNFEHGFVPSAAAKLLQNDASVLFKLSERQITPSLIPIFGSLNVGTNAIQARFTQETNGLNLNYWLNDAAGSFQLIPSGVYNNSTFLMNRTSSTVKNAFANATKLGSVSLASSTRPTVELGIGYARTATLDGGITHQNYISAIGFGGAMSDAISALVTDYLDTFCGDQLALANEWFTTSDGVVSGKNLPYQYMDISPDGTKRVWHDYYNIYYSEDSGVTVLKSFAFNFKTLGWMHMGHLMDDGTFLWATNANKVYRTTDFISYAEMSITKDGSPYTIHTPANALYPGEYFKYIGAKRKQYLPEGEEIFVYSPYNFSARGAAPANVWYYRSSFGNELKSAFEFGQNPYVTDTGTASSGTGGTPLGDPAISYKIRHTHGTTQANDDPLRFICTAGDLDRTGGGPLTFYECMWMNGVYDPDDDTWVWTQIKEGTHSSLAKTTALDMPPEYPGVGFFGGDSYELPPAFATRGVFKQPLNDLANEGSIVQLLSFENKVGFESYMNSYFMIEGTKLMGSGLLQLNPVPNGLYSHAAIYYATDFEDDIKLELLPHPGNTFTYRMQRIGAGRYLVYKADDYDYSNGEQCYEFKFN